MLSSSSLLLLLLVLPCCSGFLQHAPLPSHTGSTQLCQSSESKQQPFFVSGPDADSKPDYENIHGPMGKAVDDIFLSMFRTKLAEQVGVDSDKDKTDYGALMDLAKAMNARFSDRTEIHQRAQKTLSELFPSWMPPSYAELFSKPFPGFSSRMNAWATKMAGTWLMGECEINDVELGHDSEGNTMIGKDQGLLVKRCRFLEESQCASICVNSCKIPTQNFFIHEMGLPLTMTPDYDTFECQFAFGKMPDDATEQLARSTPCLSQCPSRGGLREWHTSSSSESSQATTIHSPGDDIDSIGDHQQQQQCQLMEN
ncbi:expressed unknown protein [Seminavis robusta]|uniref:Beta-carotene isomerase D27-like C-terminal domain-containing protein n=1 Tax=Seminavis robusta TaxID=568900 RepID=A0A9N8DYN2_9STRA|nr:expressed unknown protein [Seminavis robusta]|eukprot:Sro480_g151380.1 n/a (312) ;mRNA; f:30309-31461